MIMKDKVLFWVDSLFIQFGIAKSLQEKYDCNIYAVYDLTHFLKNLLLEQKNCEF